MKKYTEKHNLKLNIYGIICNNESTWRDKQEENDIRKLHQNVYIFKEDNLQVNSYNIV